MEPVSHDTWLIIADGSTDIAEGQRKLEELQNRVPLLRLARGYPQLVDSATMPGLKPGFYVVVLGACSDRVMADLRLGLARTVAPGAYLRPAAAEEACPAIDRATPVASGPVLGSWPVGPGSAAHFAFRRPTRADDCPDASGVVELRLEDQTLVSTQFLRGACTGTSGLSWGAPTPVAFDGTTLLWLRARGPDGDDEIAEDYLYGFFCGHWQTVLGPLTVGEPHFENTAPGRLRVSGTSGNPLLYTFDRATCSMLPAE